MNAGPRTSAPVRVPLWLAGVLLTELLLAAVLRMDGVVGLWGGERLDLRTSLQVLGLLLTPALAAASVRLVRLARETTRIAEEAQRQVRDVHQIASEWLWTVDTEGRVLESNDAVCRMLGYRISDVVGKRRLRFVHPDSRARASDAAPDAGGGGWTKRVLAWQHADNTRRYLESTATPVKDGAGQVVAYRGASRDVTFEFEATRQGAQREQEQVRRRARVEQVLLDDELLTSVFQPVVRLRDGSVAGVEALARFPGHPRRPPDVWFQEAAELSLGEELELLAMHRASQVFPMLGAHHYVALNVSAQVMVSQPLLAFFERPTTPSDRIVLELTEHAIVEDYDAITTRIQRVRELGVRLSIDDAGAGYASLRHILKLQPDFIKLDRGITANVDADPAKRSLASAMVTFGREVGADVIAEGVETDGERETLIAVGITHAQGYLLGKPAPMNRWTRSGRLIEWIGNDSDDTDEPESAGGVRPAPAEPPHEM